MKNELTNESKKKAVIYCRVSTKEQVDDGNSLVSQERICREYAEKEGYEVVEAFIERGESAKTANRKELQRLLAYCHKKDVVQAVIAYKVDRISRNIADYSYIKVQLNKSNVTIKSVTEYFEDTPAGRFMENIIANVSQFDNEVRTERSVGGMREAVQEGRYVWKAPLGYDNVRIDNKATIAPNGLAPLIKETFELISQRYYPTEVIRIMMRAKGLTDKNGNAVNRSYFFRTVRNPLYKGVIKKFGVTYPGTYSAVISEALFEDVQDVLKGRKNKVKHYIKENPDFPLRRFAVNETGKLLTGYWAKGKYKKYPYYSFGLPGTTIRKEKLEQKFADFLGCFALDNAYLNELKFYLEQHFTKRNHTDLQATNAIEMRIVEINERIDTLIKMSEKGSISDLTMAERVKKLEVELEDLKTILKSKASQDVNLTDLFRSVVNFLVDPQSYWKKASLEIRLKLQEFEFPEGVIYDGVNFRTPKICSIFKLKKHLGDSKFPRVDSRNTGKNTVLRTNTFPSDINLLESKEFAILVVTDLGVLKELLQGNNKKLSGLYEEFGYKEAA